MSTGGGGMGMGMGMSGGGGGDTAPTPVVAPVVVQQPLRWKQPLSSAGMTFSGGDTAVTVTVEASSMHRAACVTLGRDGGTVAVLATMPAGYKRRNDFSFGVGRLDSMRNLGQFGKTSNTCGLHQNSHLDWGPLPPGWRLWSLGTGTGQHWEKPFARLEDRKYTELDDNAAFAALDEGALDFIAAPNFQGARKGYSFSTRGHRTGYFRDAGPASAAGAGRFQVAGGNGMLEGGIMRLALNLSARGVDGTRTARFFRDGLEVAVFVDIKDDGSDSEWLAGVTLDTNGSARLMQAEGEELVPFVTEADMVEYELCRARQRLAFAMHGETPGIQAGLPYNVVQQVSAALPLPSLKVVLATAAQVVVIPTVAEAARVAEEAAAVRAALEKAVAEKADADRILASIASDKEAIARWLSNPSPTGQAEIAALNKKYYGMAPRAKLEELAVKYIAEEISAEEGTPPIDAESPEPVVEPTAEAPAPTPPEQLPRAAKAAPERLPQNATEWRQAQAKQVAIEQAAKASCTQPDGVQLWLAASEDDVPGTISLLDKGAPIDWQWDEKDSMLHGWTALLTACNNGAPEVAKVLVGRGANLEATTNTGRTALMTAAVAGEPSVCIALLQAGADSTARDIEGKTALDLARWASQQWTSADRPGCIAVLEVWAGGVRTQLALNAAGNLL